MIGSLIYLMILTIILFLYVLVKTKEFVKNPNKDLDLIHYMEGKIKSLRKIYYYAQIIGYESFVDDKCNSDELKTYREHVDKLIETVKDYEQKYGELNK